MRIRRLKAGLVSAAASVFEGMATLAELDSAIADLEELLNSGVESSSGDGVTQNYRTTEEINARLSQLKRQRRRLKGQSRRHPYATPTFGG